MSGVDGLPLRIIYYKEALSRGVNSATPTGFDTDVQVTEKDLQEARTALKDDVPERLRPNYVADFLREKFRNAISDTVKAKLHIDRCDPNDWLLYGDELSDAIRRVAKK